MAAPSQESEQSSNTWLHQARKVNSQVIHGCMCVRGIDSEQSSNTWLHVCWGY
jgi:hypothetical protein